MKEIVGLNENDAHSMARFEGLSLSAGGLEFSVEDVLPIVRPIVQEIARNAQISRYLRDLGRFVVRKAVKLVTEPSPPAPRIVSEIVMPLLEPFIAGVKEEAIEQIKPVAIGFGIGALVTHGVAFLVGRKTKRCG